MQDTALEHSSSNSLWWVDTSQQLSTLLAAHSLTTNAWPVSSQCDLQEQPPIPSFLITERDAIWYKTFLWSVQVMCSSSCTFLAYLLGNTDKKESPVAEQLLAQCQRKHAVLAILIQNTAPTWGASKKKLNLSSYVVQ